MRHLVYSLADRLASIVLPPHCVLCGAAGAGRARDLCDACEADLPWLETACPRCGLSTDDATDAGTAGCRRCAARYQPHRRCHAALHYAFPASELVAALKRKEIVDRVFAAGAEPSPSTPEEFGALIRAEIAKWGEVVKASGAKVD